VNEVTRERAQSFLTDDHIKHIVQAYEAFMDTPGFTRVVGLEEIRAKDSNLSIPLYVAPSETAKTVEYRNGTSLAVPLDSWLTSRKLVAESLRSIFPNISWPTVNETLNGLETCALFDRSNWQCVRFGDVVENLNETERNPEESGIERFIGLDHLEPGSLHIREWGNIADGTTFTRSCQPGQVLFGKRRAYQRKVAVAEFDAVVSGDIYVLAPKNDRLLPELLPFLCMSERFFEFAVETSAGSLSPRTNWSHLAKFEFALPPLDQQRRIAEILWAVDAIVQLRSQCITDLEVLKRAELADIFTGRIGHAEVQQFRLTTMPANWEIVTVSDISKVIRGSSPRPKGDPRYYGGDVPRVMVADITRDKKYITPRIDFLTQEGSKLSRPVEKGTLVIVCSGTKEAVGLPGILSIDACIHDGIIALTKIYDSCRTEWLYYLFNFSQRFLDSAATHGGTFVNLTTDIVKGIQLGLPPMHVQDQFIGRLSSLETDIHRLTTQLERDRNLLEVLLKQSVGTD
jgi:type I restriction enzyme, S subunit